MSSNTKQLPQVTVWVNKFVKGWEGEDQFPSVNPSMPLMDALTTRYDTDAHFVPYSAERKQGDDWVPLGKCPRVNILGLPRMEAEGGRLVFWYGVADLDCPAAHRDGKTVPQDWRDLSARAFEIAIPGCTWYQTRGGMRVIWAWPRPLDPVEHSIWLRRALKYLRETWLLDVDELTDWTRCYRLPHVRRDGVDEVHDHDLHEPAPWMPPDNFADTVRTDDDGAVLPDPWARLEEIRDPFALPQEIPAGERHTTLTRYAASLRAQGYGRADIDTRLRAEAEKYYAVNGIDKDAEQDLSNIVDWACKLPAGPSNRATKPPKPPEIEAFEVADESYDDLLERGDSVEVADWCLKQIEKASGVPCVYAQGVLWRWAKDKGRFVPVDTTVLQLLMFSMAGMRVKGRVAANGKLQTSPLKLSDNSVKDAVRVAQKKRYRPDFFRACHGIAFKNVFVRVTSTGLEKLPHSPDWCCNIGYDFDWTDNPPKQWLKFLEDVWSDLPAGDRQILIETTGEWIGVMLLGKAIEFQKALLSVGAGGNGKSSYNFVIEGVVPDGRVTHFSPHHLGTDYNRARLARALLNTTSEVPSSEISEVATAATKGIISGDWMSGRNLYETPFDFRPACGVLLATNQLPRIKDTSDGWFRRMLLLPFNVEFKGTGVRRDIGQEILDAEKAEIVCWALSHAVNVMSRREFRETASSLALKERWQEASNDVLQWLSEATVPAQPNQGTDCNTLYTAFRIWATESGIDVPLTKRQFFDRLKAKHKPFVSGPSDKRKWMYPLTLAKESSAH